MRFGMEIKLLQKSDKWEECLSGYLLEVGRGEEHG